MRTRRLNGKSKIALSAFVIALISFLAVPPSTAEPAIITADSSTLLISSLCRALKDSVPAIHFEADWIKFRDRDALAAFLVYADWAGVRVTAELPASAFNKDIAKLFEAGGGFLFERDRLEQPGALRTLARTFHEGREILLSENITPHPSRGNLVHVRVPIPLRVGDAFVTVHFTSKDGAVRLLDPTGKLAVPPTLLSDHTRLWKLTQPDTGNWTIELAGTSEARIRVEVSDVRSVVGATEGPGATIRNAGAFRAGVIPKGTIRLASLLSWPAEVSRGLVKIERLSMGDARTIYQDQLIFSDGAVTNQVDLEDGLYSISATLWFAGGTGRSEIHHAIAVGCIRPLWFEPAPFQKALVSTCPGRLRVHTLSSGHTSVEKISAHINGVHCGSSVAFCRAGSHPLHWDDIEVEPISSMEGTYEWTLQIGEVSDTWKYTVDQTAAQELILTELHIEEGWFEIKALKEIPDLSSYKVTTFEGEGVSLPGRPLSANQYVTFRFARSGRNPAIDDGSFLPRPLKIGTSKFLGIARGGAIVDCVFFSDGSPISEQLEDKCSEMDARGEWKGAPVRYLRRDLSVARENDNAGQDQNTWADWITAGYPTPDAPAPDVAPLDGLSEGAIRINELSLWDPGFSWAELLINAATPIDIAPLSLTDFDGPDERFSPDPLTVRPGELVIVRWGNGVTENDRVGDADSDGVRTIFLRGRAPSSTADEAVLLAPSGKILDRVAWSESCPLVPAHESEDMARLGLSPVPAGRPLRPLARQIATGTWEIAIRPSPGMPNIAPLQPTLGSVKIRALDPLEYDGDWVELICLNGPVDASGFVLTDLDGADHTLADEPVTLKTGDTVLIRWGEGSNEVDGKVDLNKNGVREIFISDDRGLASSRDLTDQCVLMWGDNIFDAVAYVTGGVKISRAEMKDVRRLIDKGEWIGGAHEDLVQMQLYRLPIERVDPRVDTNRKEDWRSIIPK